jgi:hypothetical protein
MFPRDETTSLQWHMCERDMHISYRDARMKSLYSTKRVVTDFTYGETAFETRHGVLLRVGPTLTCMRINASRAVVTAPLHMITDLLLFAIAEYASEELDSIDLYLHDIVHPAIIADRWRFNKIHCTTRKDAQKIAHTIVPWRRRYPATLEDTLHEYKIRKEIWKDCAACAAPFAVFPLTTVVGLPWLCAIGCIAGADALVYNIRTRAI